MGFAKIFDEVAESRLFVGTFQGPAAEAFQSSTAIIVRTTRARKPAEHPYAGRNEI